MKILFVTPSYKPAYCYGGTVIAISELAEALVKQGEDVTIYTTTANGASELDVEVNSPGTVNGVTIYYFHRITKDPTHISPALWTKLWKTCKEYDVVHLHSWWNILMIGAALICKLKRIKFVLSPHGMLSTYTFTYQRSFSKKLLHLLIGKKLLSHSFLHAATTLEWTDCMAIHKEWKGFVLHNLINFPGIQPDLNTPGYGPVFNIGFLSRIDPKKGFEILFKSLQQIAFEYKLLIAGEGDPKYISKLKDLAAELSISEKIEWCGWKRGNERFKFLESIDLFVLPSFNENFAVTVAESLAMGTAVLVSEGVGLAEYVKEKQLGWVCQVNSCSITEKLNAIYTDKNSLITIKTLAPQIIANDFKKEKLAKNYTAAYQSLHSSIN